MRNQSVRLQIQDGSDIVEIEVTGNVMDLGFTKVDLKYLLKLANIAKIHDFGDALHEYKLRTAQLMAFFINSDPQEHQGSIAPDPANIWLLSELEQILKQIEVQ